MFNITDTQSEYKCKLLNHNIRLLKDSLICSPRNRCWTSRNGSGFHLSWSHASFWQRSSCNWKCKLYPILMTSCNDDEISPLTCVFNWLNNFQLLFLCGLGFLIGMEKTFFFFFQRHKIKGSSFFFIGIIIVFLGWPIIGMISELYGSILLFGYEFFLFGLPTYLLRIFFFLLQWIYSCCSQFHQKITWAQYPSEPPWHQYSEFSINFLKIYIMKNLKLLIINFFFCRL